MKNMTKEQQLVYRWSIAITRSRLRGKKYRGRRGGDRGYPNTPQFARLVFSFGKRLLNGDKELTEAADAGHQYAIKNP